MQYFGIHLKLKWSKCSSVNLETNEIYQPNFLLLRLNKLSFFFRIETTNFFAKFENYNLDRKEYA